MIYYVKWRLLWTFVGAIALTLCLTKLTIISLSSNNSEEHPCPSSPAAQMPTRNSPELAAESMTGQEIYRYLRRTNSDACQFSVDFGFYVVVGSDHTAPDGHKAVCLDDNVAPVFENCLVYSFGINNQWSFDESMDEFGCDVYSFDPSMKFDDHDRRRHIYFYALGLDGEDRIHPTLKWKMKTAPSIYKMLSKRHGSDKPIDVMKMDVEFSEWDAIPQMIQSQFLADKVKQLAVEIHFLANDTLDTYRHRIGILQNLESDSVSSDGRVGRFVRFSSRPNPWLKRPIKILNDQPEYIGFEMAWYNSRFYNTSALLSNAVIL